MRAWICILMTLAQAFPVARGEGELPQGYDPTAIVAAVARLHAEAERNRPEWLHREQSVRASGEFDVMTCFRVLKHIAPPKEHVTARVRFVDEETAEVSIVLFSKWGGFYRVTRRVARAYPHVVTQRDAEVLLEYDCGLQF